MVFGPLTGGALGSVVGGIAGLVGGFARDREARRIRNQVREGIAAGERDTGRQLALTLSSPEFRAGTNFLRGFYGGPELSGQEIQQQLAGAIGPVAFRQTGEGVEAVDPYTQRFLEERLDTPAGGDAMAASSFDPLTQNFAKSLRQAQASRGLFQSQVGSAAEASGLAAFRTQLQMQMLPQLFELASAPVTYAQRFEPHNLQKGVFRSTGGAVAYGQPTPLAVGGSPWTSALGGLLSGGLQGAGLGIQAQANQPQAVQPMEDPMYRPQSPPPGYGSANLKNAGYF